MKALYLISSFQSEELFQQICHEIQGYKKIILENIEYQKHFPWNASDHIIYLKNNFFTNKQTKYIHLLELFKQYPQHNFVLIGNSKLLKEYLNKAHFYWSSEEIELDSFKLVTTWKINQALIYCYANNKLPQHFEVKFENFSGSLDLLLYLIKSNRYSLQQLNIFHLTEQYLSFINLHLNELPLEEASDYLSTATYLVNLKIESTSNDNSALNKLKTDLDQQQTKLINRLLQYIQIKKGINFLAIKQQERCKSFSHNGIQLNSKTMTKTKLPATLNLEKLLITIENLLSLQKYRQQQTITVDEPSILNIKELLIQKLSLLPKVEYTFESLVNHSIDFCNTRQEIIMLFLTCLILINEGKISINHSIENWKIQLIANE